MKPTSLLRLLPLALLGALAHPLAAQAPASPGTAVQWWLQDAAADRVPGISADRAYRELLAGRTPRERVVVAIIDNGVEVDHEDLRGVLWTNPREVPGNGRDDDGNGYVDDVHGWDFIGGRDGQDVVEDTYEVTRLYAACRGGAAGEGTPRPADVECDRIAADFDEVLAGMREAMQQADMVGGMVSQTMAILRKQLGSTPLTADAVRALKPASEDVALARNLYLQLDEAGITPEQIAEERDGIRRLLEKGYNPAFNPRTLVGDRYADAAERGYGNAEVEGPGADHGTHVAGIVGADRGNAAGILGIAPAARLMVLRAVPDGDERDKDVANAIRYAVDNGARVVNMSFGKGYSPQKAAVDAAVRYAESRGVLLVHAAGNGGADLNETPNFPTPRFLDGGKARLWIEVGASGPVLDSLAAPFSNYGRGQVDVFAPGVRIRSSVTNGGYDEYEGTSMAAPVVSGVAALILSYYPELTAAEVREVILQSATRFPGQQVFRPGAEDERVPFAELSDTGGVVNAYEAMRLAGQKAAARRN